jgi:hypothetical protein
VQLYVQTPWKSHLQMCTDLRSELSWSGTGLHATLKS